MMFKRFTIKSLPFNNAMQYNDDERWTNRMMMMIILTVIFQYRYYFYVYLIKISADFSAETPVKHELKEDAWTIKLKDLLRDKAVDQPTEEWRRSRATGLQERFCWMRVGLKNRTDSWPDKAFMCLSCSKTKQKLQMDCQQTGSQSHRRETFIQVLRYKRSHSLRLTAGETPANSGTGRERRSALLWTIRVHISSVQISKALGILLALHSTMPLGSNAWLQQIPHNAVSLFLTNSLGLHRSSLRKPTSLDEEGRGPVILLMKWCLLLFHDDILQTVNLSSRYSADKLLEIRIL